MKYIDSSFSKPRKVTNNGNKETKNNNNNNNK